MSDFWSSCLQVVPPGGTSHPVSDLEGTLAGFDELANKHNIVEKTPEAHGPQEGKDLENLARAILSVFLRVNASKIRHAAKAREVDFYDKWVEEVDSYDKWVEEVHSFFAHGAGQADDIFGWSPQTISDGVKLLHKSFVAHKDRFETLQLFDQVAGEAADVEIYRSQLEVRFRV